MAIFQSATKIVLLLMILALIGLTFIGKVDGKDFVIIVMVIVNFYYNDKKNTSVATTTASLKDSNIVSSNI